MLSKLVKQILFFIPLIFLFLLLWQKDVQFDEDLGRHIKLGEIITHCLCIPTTNLFSYTHANSSWFTNSWGAAVIFYEIFAHGGGNTLLILKLILIMLSFTMLYIYSWKNYSKFWTFVIAIPLLCIFYFRFGLRPEIFSFLLLALFLLLIEKYRNTDQLRFLWLLIPLEILWVNFHIYFVFGIVIYACLLLEKLFQKNLSKKLVAIFFLLLLTTLINPLTYQMALLPFTIFHNYGGTVLENQSIFTYFQLYTTDNAMNAWSFVLLEVMSGLLILSYLILIPKWRNFSVFYVCLSLLGITSAIMMIRFLPLFSMLAFFPLATNLSQLDQFLSSNWDKDMISMGKGLFVIVSSILMLAFIFSASQNQLYGFLAQENYKGAVDFVKNTHISGPMFNSFGDGAYMTLALYPQQRVFIDSRAEAYPAEFVNKYNDMLANPKIFDSWDKQYRFNYIIFENRFAITTNFINYIVTKKEWAPVYIDHIGNIVFLRNTTNNAKLIKQYAIHERITVKGL